MDKTQENIDARDIDVSRGQAQILKNIANLISKENDLTQSSLKKVLQPQSDLIYLINSNWGTSDHFIDLALDQKNSNPISLIIYFLDLKNKMNSIPTKIEMQRFSRIELEEYEEKFESWEKFLDLLGFDPWYRNDSKQKEKSRIKISKDVKKTIVNKNNYFNENDSITEITEKTNLLRLQIKDICERKDSEKSRSDYSYKEMFQMLENYLDILPNNKKYGNISCFL